MTSISALSSNTYQSPLQRLQAELQSEVSAGTVSSSDESALSSALTDIDSDIKSGGGSSSSTQGQPGDIKSKIDDLIQSEVSSGKLTSDQATELSDEELLVPLVEDELLEDESPLACAPSGPPPGGGPPGPPGPPPGGGPPAPPGPCENVAWKMPCNSVA